MRNLALAFCFSLACGGSTPNNNGDGGGPGGGDLAMGPPVTISGRVVDNSGGGGNAIPIGGANVTVAGTSTSATTAADGSYSLSVPAGAIVFIRVDAASYQSAEIGLIVPAVGGQVDKLELVPLAVVQQATQSLNPMIAVDPSKGDVIVSFNSMDTSNGYSATLSAAHGSSFSVGGGTAMYSSTTTGQHALVFPNVDPGTTTVSVSGPAGKTCNVRQAITNWRVDPNVFTNVEVDCQ
jgi:Carboxypeptidase regulatory-like domain